MSLINELLLQNHHILRMVLTLFNFGLIVLRVMQVNGYMYNMSIIENSLSHVKESNKRLEDNQIEMNSAVNNLTNKVTN